MKTFGLFIALETPFIRKKEKEILGMCSVVIFVCKLQTVKLVQEITTQLATNWSIKTPSLILSYICFTHITDAEPAKPHMEGRFAGWSTHFTFSFYLDGFLSKSISSRFFGLPMRNKLLDILLVKKLCFCMTIF